MHDDHERGASMNYPIAIFDHAGALIDRAGNVESAASVLYGDLSAHDGHARRIVAPREDCARLLAYASENADCYGIPLDIVEASP